MSSSEYELVGEANRGRRREEEEDDEAEQDDFARLLSHLSEIRAGFASLISNSRSAAYSILASRAVQKTVISSALLLVASVILYGAAVAAYLAFYYAYLPDLVSERPVHLQYGYGTNPFGIVEQLDVRDRQSYNVHVELTLPRSPANEKRGNWMVLMHLTAGGGALQGSGGSRIGGGGGSYVGMLDKENKRDVTTVFDLGGYITDKEVLYTAARPAILPYEDPLVSKASRVLFLPWHIFFPKQAEAVRLMVPMAEGLVFKRGERLPKGLLLEVQAGQGLQVYNAKVVLTAQLGGLRWVMYRWRLASFVAITTTFWVIEMGVMCATVFIVGAWLSSKGESGQEAEEGVNGKVKKVKVEDAMSDTERTFPTSSGQPPLKYESGPGREGTVKKEEEEEQTVHKVPDIGLDGDDEEEGEGSGWRDSGIGTSYSDAVRREGVVKRRNTGTKGSGRGSGA